MAESRSISAIDFFTRPIHTPCLISLIRHFATHYFFINTTMDDNNSTEMASNGASDVPIGQENVTNEVRSLALYYNNSSKVYLKEKLSYIIMLLADQCNQEAISSPMAQAGTLPAILPPEDFMKENDFYSQVSTQKWFKKAKFISSKKIIAAEIVHGMPASHTNHNNKTVVQLMTVLAQHPITDSTD
jgi:hypothetical protein